MSDYKSLNRLLSDNISERAGGTAVVKHNLNNPDDPLILPSPE